MAKLIQGTQAGDTLSGTAANDQLLGHNGADIFDLTGSTGSDTVNGQGGMDTAIFAGRIEDYAINVQDTGNLKTTVSGDDLSAELKNVETLLFDNATYDVATHSAQVTTVSIADAVAVNEGAVNAALNFTLTRTGDLSRALDVYYTLDGTATAGSDYVNPSVMTVHFDAGSATAVLSPPVINDTAFEPTETVGVHLVADSHYNFATGAQTSATGSILDNDANPSPLLHISNASAVEGQNLVFHVSIDAPTDHDITFQAFTDTGTHMANPSTPGNIFFGNATAGNLSGGDYDGFMLTTYTIHAGDTSVDISVHARTDLLTEGPETMSLRIQNPTGSTITPGVGTGRGIGTIIDNPPAPVTHVSFYADPVNPSNPPGFNQVFEGNDFVFHFHRDVTTTALDVHYLFGGGFPGGTATPGADFTVDDPSMVVHFAAGQADADLVLHITDDHVAENAGNAEAFTVQFDFAANGPNVQYDGTASSEAYLAAGGTNATQVNIAQILDHLL